MPEDAQLVSPGPSERTVRTAAGEVLTVPDGWELLPPGDAGLTRRVKAAGPTWTVQEKRGRKKFSRGVWAPGRTSPPPAPPWKRSGRTPAYAKRARPTRNGASGSRASTSRTSATPS